MGVAYNSQVRSFFYIMHILLALTLIYIRYNSTIAKRIKLELEQMYGISQKTFTVAPKI
jgi:hypothetical protein